MKLFNVHAILNLNVDECSELRGLARSSSNNTQYYKHNRVIKNVNSKYFAKTPTIKASSR